MEDDQLVTALDGLQLRDNPILTLVTPYGACYDLPRDQLQYSPTLGLLILSPADQERRVFSLCEKLNITNGHTLYSFAPYSYELALRFFQMCKGESLRLREKDRTELTYFQPTSVVPPAYWALVANLTLDQALQHHIGLYFFGNRELVDLNELRIAYHLKAIWSEMVVLGATSSQINTHLQKVLEPHTEACRVMKLHEQR